MPIPKPKANESEDEFLQRCMADEIMLEEYSNEKQRYAVCLAQWEGKEDKKSVSYPVREIRMAEIRALEPQEENEMAVEGRAIVYESPTLLYEWDGIKYYEVIARGALDGADLSDVPLRYNHADAVMVMARTRNKTLELIPDDQGLLIRAKLANTSAGRDLYELIKRGDVDKMSFAFTVAEDNYDRSTRTRRILKFKRIWDVSAVDTPAYADTYIAARSYFEAQEEAARQEEEKQQRLKKALLAKLYV